MILKRLKSINNFKTKFFIIFFIISLLATTFVYIFKFNGPPIRSDGIGYYSYLPSLFIHHDLTMNKLIQERAQHYNEVAPNSWNGIYKYGNTNKYLDKYPIGAAIMMSPFYIIADILTIITFPILHQPHDGFNNIYQVIVGLSGLIYLNFGLILLEKILSKYFKKRIIYPTLVLIIFGTNLFHYGTYDAIFSHVFSFFLFCVLLYLLSMWYKNISLKKTIFLGIISALIILVRPTNIIFLIFIPLLNIYTNYLNFNKTTDINFDIQHKENINLKKIIYNRFKFFTYNIKYFFIFLITIIICILPLFIYWKYITGNWIVFAYPGEYFNFLHPQILKYLFSVTKGLFFWSPLLLIAFAGLFIMRKRLKNLFIHSIIILILQIFIASSWWDWSYGGSFGQRSYIEYFVILVFPLACILEYIYDKSEYNKHINLKKNLENENLKQFKNSYIKTNNIFEFFINIKFILLIIFILLVIFNLYIMYKYWNHSIPINGATWEIYKKVIFKL